MCGICGIATRGATPNRERLRRMTDTIVHCGPDGDGFFLAPGIGLGMRRLAIIDLANGDQPLANESATDTPSSVRLPSSSRTPIATRTAQSITEPPWRTFS